MISESQPEPEPSLSPTVTVISIEGIVGVGKSYLINQLKTELIHINSKPVIFLQEPIDIWTSVKDSNSTILEKFYNDQKKYAFSFQTLVLVTMAKLLRETILQNPNAIIITERSIFSSKHIFVQSLFDSNMITDVDYQIYNMLFDEIEQSLQHVVAAIIYIKAPVATCFNQIAKRNRKGEDNISLNYLISCQEYHDTFFQNSHLPKVLCDNFTPQSVLHAIFDFLTPLVKF
tara:strand:+ start:813 stop:1505 length:693 start_codon:yes stop_codon:yes gene_type:complete